MVSASGLMATAQLALIAKDFGIDKTVLLGGGTVLGRGAGGGQPCQRRRTAVLRLGVGPDRPRKHDGHRVLAWRRRLSACSARSAHSPWLFVLFAALIFFTWGEIFSLFPSTCTDAFGPRYATTNAGLLYTAKGTSALLVPLANVIKSATGSWYTVFVAAAAMNFVVVILALFVLRPLRRAHEGVNTMAPEIKATR